MKTIRLAFALVALAVVLAAGSALSPTPALAGDDDCDPTSSTPGCSSNGGSGGDADDEGPSDPTENGGGQNGGSGDDDVGDPGQEPT